ncbi:unnamed protein product [Adineta ricciae]|uniref:Uncharacterized protein n=1 Tax=Adineta ricciae TaxID=249248 RepID=A0A815WKD3_ADIRI|nr:unnamed protein product [Adineta ricciae]CAF1545875.1 unnamed protein product [Adineta ricciae]
MGSSCCSGKSTAITPTTKDFDGVPKSPEIPPKAPREPTPDPSSSESEDEEKHEAPEPPSKKQRPPARYNKIGISTEDPSLLIKGYEKKPLCSLEEALERFEEHIPNLDGQIQEAKSNCHFPSQHGLTHDEAAALYLYLVVGSDDSVRSYLQRAWDSNERKQMKPWFKYLRLLKNGLDKLPDVRVEIWQGMPYDKDVMGKLEEDSLDLFTCMGLATPSKSQVLTDLDDGSDGEKILVGYSSVSGKDVSNYSPKKGTDSTQPAKDVLMWPGCKVNKSQETVSDGNGCVFVHLKQKNNAPREPMPPPTPTPQPNETPKQKSAPPPTPTPQPNETPKQKSAPPPKHFQCPIPDDPYAYFTMYQRTRCQNRCNGNHAGNHCHGFERVFHNCAHHCEPVEFRCSRCSKHTRKLYECKACRKRFCHRCCFQ